MEFEKLQQIIAEVLNIDPDTITVDSRFIDDLSADSLDIFEIITSIEDAFDITIDDSQAESIVTVGDAAEAIRNAVK
ncbi:MAG: acyl carrier protein [Lachnospiraceae bacterium]|jgi:acyl carrier protein|nr:acyl carrier protein [Lachnospiraceae bacterium]MBQ1285410.1 acyl carrier protein [Lachnospiraceae bacterium]MBR2842025.1 acyl carrier protein [Lachnospiraceae bacterium]MBR3261935.1 acyl carrier protein [Lachnospiraceae bacterium]